MLKQLTLFILLLTSQAYGQTTISGVVKEMSGTTIPGANIYLKDSFDGDVSSLDGRFSFTTDLTGQQTIIVSFVGFKPFEKTLQISTETLEIEVILEEEINKVDGVTITAGAYTSSDVKKNTVLKPLDIVTTASAAGDIMGAINTLPGTATVGESGRLFVRGGEGYETKVFIDGLEVRGAFQSTVPNVPTRGRFSPFLFKGTSFSTGGYSAEYGQALSSALILNSNDFPQETQTDISLMSVGGDIAHTKAWEKTSVSAKIQATDLRPYQGIIKQNFEWEEAPNSLGSELVIRHKVNKEGLFKLYVNTDNSNMRLRQRNLDSGIKDTLGVGNKYLYLNANYRDILNKKWSLKGGVSVTSNKDDFNLNSDQIIQRELSMHSKLTAQWDASDRVSVNMGTEWINRSFDQSIYNLQQNVDNRGIDDHMVSNFLETDYFASNRFVVRGGLRTEYISLTNKLFVNPRLAMSYKLNNEGQFSLAYGQFVQSPQNQFSIVQPNLKSEKAQHFILNYQLIKNNRVFRIETYYKDYQDLVKFSSLNDTMPDNYNNLGFGHAKGFDLFWRDNETFKNTDYWVSYSYVDAERNYQNFNRTVRPPFLSEHNFSVVVKHFVESIRTQFGATFNYASSRLYHDPNREGFQNSRTPAFQDVSVNAALLIKQHIILYMSSSNVFGRDNVFGYEFGSRPNEQGVFDSRAIGQPAKRFVFVGLFITLTKNKEANQLDNL